MQVCWASGTDRTRAAFYTLSREGEIVGTTAVDQTVGGGAWRDIGVLELADGQSCEVTLTASGELGQVVVADAARIVLVEE